MKTYYANPNYAEAGNSDNWVVVGAQSADVSVNDLTQLAVGNISAPTSASTTGYYFAQVEDLTRLTKGWSYLTKTNLGPRNQANDTFQGNRPQAPVSEPYVYVAEINGFLNGDTLAVLEGQQENQPPFSNAATSSDYGTSQWSVVRNAGLIPLVSTDPGNSTTSFLQPENSSSLASRLIAYNNIDYGDTNYGNTYTDDGGNTLPVPATKNYGSKFTPTPDNLGNGTTQNWYLVASGDDTAQANLLTMLPDFTTDGEQVVSVQVGQTATTVTLSAANSAFTVGQTLTIVTNSTGVSSSLPYLSTSAPMGWFAGKITSIAGATLYTDLNDTTSNTGTLDPLPGSLNNALTFTGTVLGTNTITISAVGSTSNYGIAAGHTLTLTNTISTISSTASTFTVTTSATHYIVAGQQVTIAGVTGATYTPYNGTWTVATVGATTFTVTSTINPGTVSPASATASQQAYVGSIIGNGVGAVITLDAYGGPMGLNTAITNGSGISFSANYLDNNVRAYAATITNYTLRVNDDGNKLDCQYSTAPYYAQNCKLSLSSALSTTGATTQVVLRNNDVYDYTIYGATNGGVVVAVISGDNYQEITVTSDTTILGFGTATATATSFTPNFAYPARITSLYDVTQTKSGDNDRYGKVLVLPVIPQIYRNAPIAQFKSMTALSGGITETISGSTYYYGTVGSTYFSSDPYTVSVDDVSNINVGDTLTFRNDYNPWFSNYTTKPPTSSEWSTYGDNVPWSWTLTDSGASGFTCTSGATFIILPDANGYSLPLVKGQAAFGAPTYVPNGAKVTGWNATQIFFDQNTTATVATPAQNIRFYPGTSGFNYWKVYSVNTADNTFVIYGSSGAYEQISASYGTNGDSQNYIFDYSNHLYAGNTVDISSTIGVGAGVVGLSSAVNVGPEVNLSWHTTNTVIASYAEGGRYIGSESLGDQEVAIPYRLGSLIGSTLAVDIIAQTSTAIVVNALPNTAASGIYNPSYTLTDYNQYGNSPAQLANLGQNAGFAILSTESAYSTNYSVGNVFPLVVGGGDTQEVVLVQRGTSKVPNPIDGGTSLNSPMVWNLASGQSFQYDHDAGDPVCLPNFIYKSAGTISHAANAPVVGLPDTGTVYG